ncbi:MAG: DUF4249 domain-containing protein [Melioribacteraceae bacterium]|jgi:hypothetical protein|nr:DUF4249 domain-containing protein [Melioribacteraceae bacterium]
MKKYKKIGYASLLLLLFIGCEDIIVVDLNTADPTIVIEATITDDNSPSRVTITKSTDFYTPGVYPTVSEAQITVNDSEGNNYTFDEIEEGVYENSSLIGKSNVEYSIEVLSEGKTYDAVSTIPNQLIIDSLGLEPSPNRPGGKDGAKRFILHIYFQDQLGIDDYSRLKLFSNGVQLGGFNIYTDKFTDGNYIDFRMNLNTESDEINIGDLIRVELMSIDKAAYDFYLTANSVNASGGNGRGPSSTSAAPTNPVTNWSNKALGYFSAYRTSKSEIVLSE